MNLTLKKKGLLCIAISSLHNEDKLWLLYRAMRGLERMPGTQRLLKNCSWHVLIPSKSGVYGEGTS
jgi:hypothetical protein